MPLTLVIARVAGECSPSVSLSCVSRAVEGGRSQPQEPRLQGPGTEPPSSVPTESSKASMAICVRQALRAQFGIKCSAGTALVRPVPRSNLESGRKALGVAYKD